MEVRANYLLIGGFAVAFVVALFGFMIWLEQWGLGEKQQRYRVVFSGDVTPADLNEGAQVLFNGVDVGSVRTIRLNPKNSQQALAIISVNADTPIRTDSVASEGSQGFTGRTYLTISDGSPDAPLLEPKGDQLPTIPAKAGGLSAIMDKAPKVADRILKVADQASNLLGGGQNQDLSAIIRNLRQVTDTLASRDQEIGAMIDNLAQASASVKRAAQQAETMMQAGTATMGDVQQLVAKDVQPAVRQGQQAANQIADAAQNVNQLVAENRQPIRQFTSDGFTEFRHLISEARQLVQELRDVTERLRENPSQFLLGGNQGGFQPEKR
jgi:phospholipid/cholesterol/gamma-HCH transport system substrate-binding protein